MVLGRGVAPRFPACHAGVLLLNEPRMVGVTGLAPAASSAPRWRSSLSELHPDGVIARICTGTDRATACRASVTPRSRRLVRPVGVAPNISRLSGGRSTVELRADGPASGYCPRAFALAKRQTSTIRWPVGWPGRIRTFTATFRASNAACYTTSQWWARTESNRLVFDNGFTTRLRSHSAARPSVLCTIDASLNARPCARRTGSFSAA